VTAPAAGAKTAGTNVDVTWTATNTVAGATVNILALTDSTWTVVASGLPATGVKYVWTAATGVTKIKVQLASDASVSGSSAAFTVAAATVTPPAAKTVTVIDLAATLTAGTAVDIIWAAANYTNNDRIDILAKDGTNWTVLAADYPVNATKFVWTPTMGITEVKVQLAGDITISDASAAFVVNNGTVATIVAPAAPIITDKPGDNGHYFYANFTPSSTTTVTSYLFFVWDANLATPSTTDSTWVNFAAASTIPAVSGKVTYLVPTPYTETRRYAIVASTGTAFSLLKQADGEIGVAELVETAAAKTAGVQYSDFSATASGAARDNTPPAAFTIASATDAAGVGTGITITWNALPIVGYFGNSVQMPIYGADYYEIYRAVKGTTTFTKVGQTANPTTNTFTDVVADGSTIYNYYVRAVDGYVLDNPTTMDITGTKAALASLGGSDYNSDGIVGYTDFILFASAFGSTSASAGFVSNFDLNGDGVVNNADFILFAVAFNQTPGSAKIASELPSSNISMNMNAEFNAASSTYYVTVNLSDKAVNGFQFNLAYDTKDLEYVQNSVTGLGELSIIKTDENGILVNAAFIPGEKFDGSVTLAFRAKGTTSDLSFDMLSALVTVDNITGTIGKLASASVKAMPSVYALSQNFPNPFNPTTTIEYSIPTAGHVDMVIYNMAGQKVRTLVNEVKSPAFYKVVWDGRNDRGETVASGLYFYKLVSGSFNKIAKMTLVK
jgi:hypothetical protein